MSIDLWFNGGIVKTQTKEHKMLTDYMDCKVLYAPEHGPESIVMLQAMNTPAEGDPESLIMFLDTKRAAWVLTSDLSPVTL